MKQNYTLRRTLSALLFLFVSSLSWAYELTVGDYFNVDKWWFVITSDTSVYLRNYDDIFHYPEHLGIPSHVTHEGKTYKVTAIGNGAFSGHFYRLESISIPTTVDSIGDFAFSNCSAIKSIYIPGSVIKIGHRAFSHCSSLESISFPYSQIEIGDYAFAGCSSLTSIYFPTNVASIGESAFEGCTALTSVNIHGSVHRIKRAAFSGCTSLIYALIGNGVTDIEAYAFQGCTSLIAVDLPLTLTSIGRAAFSGCSSLVGIEIPYNVTNIGIEAFYRCTSLRFVVIENSVRDIANSVFQGCSSLTTVVCRAKTVPSVNFMFTYVPVREATLYVPASALEDYKQADGWENFGTILPIEGNEDVIDGIDSPVARQEKEADAAYYTLDGKPTNAPVRGGIYIRGGKKVLY